MKPGGSRLGPYEIQSSIGAGGMGEVYRARDTRLDRIVAVKVIAGTAALDPSFRERFDREARAISALDHPNICTLYDVGHEDGTDFLVMQYLEGETLADRLARGARPKTDGSGVAATAVTSLTSSRGPLTVDLALRYGVEIAAALHAAHRRGIVHRNLKPGNIMLTKTGIRLLEFGLAKLAEQGAIAGRADFATKSVPLTATGSIVGRPRGLQGRSAARLALLVSLWRVMTATGVGRRTRTRTRMGRGSIQMMGSYVSIYSLGGPRILSARVTVGTP